ncbi:dihydrodipicolinate synthase/N-acetylneuraminate lyase [Clostridium intestinale]|uniref:Dihydrodipicolinate synthase/N-acetylneuraminate lyase n=1 Tax=Clostridium intestinale URNW TaxID=1294142 RepID=U2NKU0_9CLOT|nr:dihydrodipicolinate synthase/N-acetylneuraminate lyase [Clostridium intestinale]ERK29486.1 dihydrodipicolinate synthase/N-acetylneuraminate lyase [Clostridium intestinale URNW]
MSIKESKFVPEIKGILRNHVIEVPTIIRNCSGIKIFGKRIKSLLFTTDVAIIRNTNADAIIAVYPFTPQPLITQALVMAADVPVFCGVGGGITQGKRVVNLALDAEFKGAMGVVVNAPTSNEIIKKIRNTIDIPVIVTMVSENENIEERIGSGATILNVSGGKNTASIVKRIKDQYPEFPVIATGGPTEESIRETILAGANAITYTPPLGGDIMSDLMDKYRNS